MKEIKPCKCGGIPFITPYFADSDTYREDEMFLIRCYKCGTTGKIELSEDEAVLQWNIHTGV